MRTISTILAGKQRWWLFVLLTVLMVALPDARAQFSIEKEPGVNPWTHLNFHNNPDNFQFAIVTDLTGRERPGVFRDAVRKLNLLQPEFVMSIGDLIEGHTNDAAQLHRDWDQFMEAVHPLEMPFFLVPGNHDYWYASTQNWDGSRNVYDMASVYKQRVGRSYYHFVYKNVLFLVLNNSMGDPAEREEQKKYVTKTLTQYPDVRWTFTFFHYPSWFSKRDEIWKQVAPLLKDRPFTAFAGNSHNYLKYERGGREYIVVATTGGMSRMRGPRYGEFDHLVWVTVTDEGPRIANLMLDGIYDTNIRTEKSRALTAKLLREPPVTSPVLWQDEDAFGGATTRLKFANDADVPLKVEAVFAPHDSLKPQPAVIETVVPAGSTKHLDLDLRVDSPVPAHQLRPLVMHWRAIHDLPGSDPDVEVDGNHRIVVDARGERPRAAKPHILEDFAGPVMHPAWIPLGPGGSFNGKGQLTLSDDPDTTEAPGRQFTDGRGIYTLTRLWHLPAAGVFRDIPAGTFEAQLRLTNIRWSGDNTAFRWEFWDTPDRVYNYGPSFLSAVILQLYQDEASGQYYIEVGKFDKRRVGAVRGVDTGTQRVGSYQDPKYTKLGEVPLESAPATLTLRASWRESTNRWRLYYGVGKAKAQLKIPGGDFVDDIVPSPDGKRNLIYIRQADKHPGFTVDVDDYRLLQ